MVPSSASFPAAERLVHERLDVYQVGLEFLTLAHDLVRRLPRTKGQLGDQLERAAESIVLRIAEAAGAETGSPLQRSGFCCRPCGSTGGPPGGRLWSALRPWISSGSGASPQPRFSARAGSFWSGWSRC